MPLLIQTEDGIKRPIVYVNVDGTWKQSSLKWVNVNGVWKSIDSCVAMGDNYDCVQDGAIRIKISDVIKNDIFAPGISFKSVSLVPNSNVGGTMEIYGDELVFNPNVKTGTPAFFKYRLVDSTGNTSDGLISINVTRLPDLEAYIMDSGSIVIWVQNFKPPTLADVFKSWARIADINGYYAGGVTPPSTSEASKWQMISDNQFRCTINSSYETGFISPKEYDTYNHEATLSSTNADDDYIGLIIAAKRINGVNNVLWVGRTMNGYDISSYFKTTTKVQFFIAHFTFSGNSFVRHEVKNTTNSSVTNGVSNGGGSQGWITYSPTKLRVERTPTGVTCYTSPFKSSTLNKNVALQINFDDYSYLSWCKEPCSYGYICFSQNYSSWTNIVFEGNDLNSKEAYDYETNSTWTWTGSSWTQTNTPIQDSVGWPRTLVSVETGEKFETYEGGIKKIS